MSENTSKSSSVGNSIEPKASEQNTTTSTAPLSTPSVSSNKNEVDAKQAGTKKPKKELGGPKGLEPTRYGDWESKGRCYDF